MLGLSRWEAARANEVRRGQEFREQGGGPLIDKVKGAMGCVAETEEREKLVKDLEKLVSFKMIVSA